jgi:hypothetical protein
MPAAVAVARPRCDAAARAARDRANRRVDDFGDAATVEFVELAQHQDLAERVRQRPDEALQHFGLGRHDLFTPYRRLCIVGDVGRHPGVGATRPLGATHIAQNRQQPGLDRRAAKAVEIPKGAQTAFLHGVVGIGGFAQQIARQGIHVVDMRQRGVVKTPCLVIVVGGSPHQPVIAFNDPKRPRQPRR